MARISWACWLVVCCVLWMGVLACEGPGSETPCLNNGECPLKGEVCLNNRCLKQKSCSQDTDCVYKGETCVNGLCSTDTPLPPSDSGPVTPPKTCATACVVSSECATCEDGRNSCISGSCVKAERAAAYARCGSDVGKACSDGLVCVGGSATKFCVPECDPKQTRCNDGKGECFDPNNLGVGLCIPDGQATEGSACSPNFTGDTTLDAGKLCQKGLFCNDNKVCAKPVQVADYKACGSGRNCADTSTCVRLTSIAIDGYCLPKCDIKVTSCNGTKGRCLEISGGEGACLPVGTSKEDTACGPEGDTLLASMYCEPGLVCAGITPTKGVCLKTVTQCSETACPQGRLCLSGQSGGVCALSCEGDTCPNNLVCEPLDGSTNKICAPPQPSAP